MTVASVAREHYVNQAAIARGTAGAVEALWRQLDTADLSGSFLVDIGTRMAQVVAAGQFAAAADANDYVTGALEVQAATGPTLPVDPRAFTGTTAAGGDLRSLMYGAVVGVKSDLGHGLDLATAMLRGQATSVLYGTNEVQQAGRNAGFVAMTGSVSTGYIRMATPPSCSRCAILAGRHYRWSSGFRRHPHCDCVHVPYAEAAGVQDMRTDPLALVREGKVTGLSRAETDAVLNQGADLNQVVNAHRKGMYEFDTTRSGATVRQGRAGRQIAKAQGVTDPGQITDGHVERLTVRSIYRLAGEDRIRALELLAKNGYLRETWTPDFRRSIKHAFRDLGVEWNAGTKYQHT